MSDHSIIGVEIVNCPICDSAPTKVWLDDGKPTRYVRCLGCGTVYASPRAPHSIRYDWLDKQFGFSENAFSNAESRRSALEREAAIVKHFVKSGSILDIGCDIGILFEWFMESNWQRFGVELSPSAAKYAAENYTAQVVSGTIRQAAFPSNSFDIVTMIDMFYYVDDPCGELREVARITKPGGILAIEIPGREYQLQRSRGIICWILERRKTRLRTDSPYLFWFGSRELWQLLRNNGFSVIATYAIGSHNSTRTWFNALEAAYCHIVDIASRVHYRFLDWSPKYLVVAKRNTI